jgi:hypothetical protein
MRAIEIFKTNVKGKQKATFLIDEMHEHFPEYNISIDLEDHDKVLRVENKKGKIHAEEVIKLLKKRNFNCEVLNY